jgi:pimeloyl-ACP methyl ester carboxylesterase
LEHASLRPAERYHKIDHDPAALANRDPEITIAEDSGHFVHSETPDRASAKIAEFFGRVKGQ